MWFVPPVSPRPTPKRAGQSSRPASRRFLSLNAKRVNQRCAGYPKQCRRTPAPVRNAEDSRDRRRSGLGVLTRQRADEIDDLPPHLGVLHPQESAVELQALGAGEEVNHVACRFRLAHTGTRLFRRAARCVLKEERYRDLEDARNVLQAARANPVRALFVFLNLLESDTKILAKLFLAHA